jgi:hypothetical protein
MRDIEAFLQQSPAMRYRHSYVQLLPYRFQLLGIESPFDLMNSKVSEIRRTKHRLERSGCARFLKDLWQPDSHLSPGKQHPFMSLVVSKQQPLKHYVWGGVAMPGTW